MRKLKLSPQAITELVILGLKQNKVPMVDMFANHIKNTVEYLSARGMEVTLIEDSELGRMALQKYGGQVR